jgi:hypothetical protein
VIRSGLVIVALVLLASTARAGEAPATSYAVIAFDVDGNTDGSLPATVQAGLSRGAAEAGADVVAYDEVVALLAKKPALLGCLSPSCLASIAEVVGTDQMLEVTITANGANYDLALALVGPEGVIRRRTGTCTVCTVSDLADLAATRLTDLLTAVAGSAQSVEIASTPPGAALDIPGAGAQTSPWRGELPPGSVTIDAHKPGYLDAHQEITVVDDGSEQHFDIVLGALGPPPPRFRLLKWITAGGAFAALVTGTVLLAMDGDPSCGVSGATCPREYATGTAGAIIGVLGLGAAGAAGWMFWTDHREQAAVTPVHGGAVASVRLQF